MLQAHLPRSLSNQPFFTVLPRCRISFSSSLLNSSDSSLLKSSSMPHISRRELPYARSRLAKSIIRTSTIPNHSLRSHPVESDIAQTTAAIRTPTIATNPLIIVRAIIHPNWSRPIAPCNLFCHTITSRNSVWLSPCCTNFSKGMLIDWSVSLLSSPSISRMDVSPLPSSPVSLSSSPTTP